MPFAVSFAATASAVPLFFYRLFVKFSGDQFALFEIADGLRDDLRVRSVNRDALRHQHAQRHAADCATKHGIHADTRIRFVLVSLQGNVFVLPGFGVKKQKGIGLVQIRLDRRFKAFVLRNRNA